MRRSGLRWCWRTAGRLGTLLPLISATAFAAQPAPSLQEVQIAGRVLHFQSSEPSGPLALAIVFSRADPHSFAEAEALLGLLGPGLRVGDLILQPVLVEQSALPGHAGYGALFATVGVDAALLAAALGRLHVPCLTRHVDQVEHGSCTVAIRSDQGVTIILNSANAAAAGIHFAAAFRMMVREL